MPAFAHIIISLVICIFLYKITEGKFTLAHCVIFAVSNLYGPDISSFLPTIDGLFAYGFEIPEIYYFFHGLGWILIALILTIPWDIAVNRKERKMKIQQVFYLVVAGGFFHLFVDIIGHPSYINYNGVADYPWGVLWIGWDLTGTPMYLSINSILGTGMFPCGNHFAFIETYIFFGITALIVFGLLFFYAAKSEKSLIKSFVIITLAYVIPMAIFYYIPDYSGFDVNAVGVNYYGTDNVHSTYRIVGGEADLGVLLYFTLLFFIPLMLIYYSFNDKLEKPQIEIARVNVKEEEEKGTDITLQQ